VPEVNQRLALYKRLTSVATMDALADLGAELTDRFGPLPPEVAQLLDIVGLRVTARSLGIEKIEAGKTRALVTFSPGTSVDPDQLIRLIQKSKGRLKMKREYTLEAAVAGSEWPELRNSLRGLLAELGAR
jgi:transcription-repair coupling factor (superfamily II helicase)